MRIIGHLELSFVSWLAVYSQYYIYSIFPLFPFYAGVSGQIACQFDNLNACGFTTVSSNFPWGLSRLTVPTPNTGPSADQSNPSISYYAHFESTFCLTDRSVFRGSSFVSPEATEQPGTTLSVAFYIFLRGSGIGLFELIRDDNSATFSDWMAGSWRQTISQSEDTNPQWRQVQFEVPINTASPFKIKLAAYCNGTSVFGDIAVDTIQTGVWSAPNCPALCSSETTGTRTCVKGSCAGPGTQCCPCSPQCPWSAPPRVNVQPANINANQRDRAEFTCEARATPPVSSITWLKEATVISPSANYLIATVLSTGRSVLTIVSASSSDAGAYTCRVTNAAGSSDGTATLSLTAPFGITVAPVATTAAVGSNAIFTCAATGSSVTIAWSKNAAAIVSGAQYRIDTSGVGVVQSTLTVLNVSPASAGLYTCRASSGSENQERSAMLTVMALTVVTITPAAVATYQGGEAVFTCTAVEPPLTVGWIFRGISLSDGAKHKIVLTNGPLDVKSVLTVRNVVPSDVGLYTCKASNGVTTDEKLAALSITSGIWLPWGEWSTCSVTCGKGTIHRHRTCQPNTGICDGSTIETQECDTRIACPTICDLPRDSGLCTQAIPRWFFNNVTRVCERFTYGGCGGNANNFGDELACKRVCPICPPITCTLSCPAGFKIGPDGCPICECRPEPGVWGLWSTPPCPVTCGKGYVTRHRHCLGPNDCVGPSEEQIECTSAVICPGRGVWGEWSNPPCPVTCGKGSVTRRRQCVGPGTCEGDSEQVVECDTNRTCPVVARWSDWTPYTDCTRTCGGGQSIRARYCNNPPPAGPTAPMCMDSAGKPAMTETQVTACNVQCCAVNGYWDEWGAYGECSKSCGRGTQLRRRRCVPPVCGGEDCRGDTVEISSCNTDPCPVNGGWGNWTAWTPCSGTCGPQTRQERTRECNNPPPQYGGANCVGDSREAQLCPVKEILICPVLRVGDCNFESADATCGYLSTYNEDKGPHWLVNQGRTPTMYTGPAGDTTFPVSGSGHYIYFEASDINPATTADFESPPIFAYVPVYCLMFNYHMFDNNTGFMGKLEVFVKRNGRLQKAFEKVGNQGVDWQSAAVDLDVVDNVEFDVVFRATRGPEYLSDIALDDIRVTRNKCVLPVDGKWSEWSNWTSCERECNHVKYQSRDRYCEGPANMGKPCVGNTTEIRQCPPKPCPVDGGWGSFTAWTPCPTDKCGVQTVQQHMRECNNPPPSFGGLACQGPASELRPCPFLPCPVPGTWTPFGPWSVCDKLCGGGHTHRYRTCRTIAPSHGGQDCVGDEEETMACNTQPCNVCPVGQLPVACTFDPCSNTTCEAFSGAICLPNYCGTCHADFYVMGLLVDCRRGVWGNWSDWSGCDKTCGGGHQHRDRQCLVPPCQGPSEETRACSTEACPSSGCPPDRPPVVCSTNPCLMATCPLNPTATCRVNNCGGCYTEWRVVGHLVDCGGPGWSDWSAYSDCSVSCGTGVKTRTRQCNSPPPKVGEVCLGPDRESSTCVLPACPLTGGWTAWSNYNTCTGGQKTRYRECTNPLPPPGGSCIGPSTETVPC